MSAFETDVTTGYGEDLHLTLEASDKEHFFPNCQQVQLISLAYNDWANFRLPVGKSSLEIEPICLECSEDSGGPLQVEGQVTGSELRGSHLHIRMLNTYDWLGLSLREGARVLAK